MELSTLMQSNAQKVRQVSIPVASTLIYPDSAETRKQEELMKKKKK